MERVFHPQRGEGPVHLLSETSHSLQAWCGSRAQFRHRVRPGSREEVTCKRCLSAIRKGRPQSRR